MNIGDPIEVCRPVVVGGKLAHRWVPATIASIDSLSIVAVFADFSRHEYQPDANVIRLMQRRVSETSRPPALYVCR
jgi:hypothetical protein